uniref:UvrD-like helicase, ATP-binding domain, P-loop containing nucleoside triphosphate hydrolase n=1 Tax=Tanacetum cinerariifolium TaxID=118510 RepID=A0A699JX15_TANCI|nr:UvrD-like helicase, ATP-binding domain, P-loop containing nucleoside triphosphate hydrolase [Tanacetum cinerariifolium]
MGYRRSVQDEVLKISISVFITNFLDQAGTKELWNTCKQYGHVVDAFIPDRRSKIGKSFGFVRFIKVFDAKRDTTNTPSLVIGDDYVNQEDYSCCLNEKVKEFGSLSNLKVVLGNEGFNEIGIRYLGGFDFVVDGRVAWVEVEGIPLKVWTDNTFKRIASKWGTLLSIDTSEEDCYHNKQQLDEDSEPEDDIFGGVDKPNTDNSEEELEDENVVSDTMFDDGSVKPSVVKNSSGNQGNKSEDPFDLYPVEKEVGCNMDKQELNCDNLNGGVSNQGDHVNAGIDNSYSKREGTESVGSGRFKKGNALCTGGSILTVMDELIKVGQTMGFKMDGCMKNIEEIIKSQRVNEVFR